MSITTTGGNSYLEEGREFHNAQFLQMEEMKKLKELLEAELQTHAAAILSHLGHYNERFKRIRVIDGVIERLKASLDVPMVEATELSDAIDMKLIENALLGAGDVQGAIQEMLRRIGENATRQTGKVTPLHDMPKEERLRSNFDDGRLGSR